MKKRICIYAKDIQLITGRSERYAYKIIAKIKRVNGKRNDQLITIKEFAEFSGIDEQQIRELVS